jgi:hypothetical protein
MKTLDSGRWIPRLANHAEKHEMQLVLFSSIFDRWNLEYRRSQESGLDPENLSVDRYKQLWRSTPQMKKGWTRLKSQYPSDFVEFIDTRVVT